MNPSSIQNLQATALSLFQASSAIFWSTLPVALLLAMLVIYVSGEISGAKLESVFRRLLLAILLLVAFPQISRFMQQIESTLVSAFGGETPITQIFSKVGDKAAELNQSGLSNWIKIGQIGMTIISTLSFLILSVVKHFLDVLHLSLWNLLHILCPLALLGCLFPSFSNIPKGIFIGMLELSLWKPTWVILARILIALGFGETPTDPSQWFDTAVMNFAVAGLMVSTPMIVHGFLSGTLASVGGTAVQTMLAGAGAALATLPMQTIRGTAALTQRTAGSIGQRTWSYTKAQLRPTKPQANPNLNQKPNTYSKGNQFYGVPKTHRDPSTKPKK